MGTPSANLLVDLGVLVVPLILLVLECSAFNLLLPLNDVLHNTISAVRPRICDPKIHDIWRRRFQKMFSASSLDRAGSSESLHTRGRVISSLRSFGKT